MWMIVNRKVSFYDPDSPTGESFEDLFYHENRSWSPSPRVAKIYDNRDDAVAQIKFMQERGNIVVQKTIRSCLREAALI